MSLSRFQRARPSRKRIPLFKGEAGKFSDFLRHVRAHLLVVPGILDLMSNRVTIRNGFKVFLNRSIPANPMCPPADPKGVCVCEV